MEETPKSFNNESKAYKSISLPSKDLQHHLDESVHTLIATNPKSTTPISKNPSLNIPLQNFL